MSDGERTMRATQRRRREARQSGFVVRSRELAIALQLLVGMGVFFMLGRTLVESLGTMLAGQLRAADSSTASVSGISADVGRVAFKSAVSLLPLLAVFLFTAIASVLGQTGVIFLPSRMVPNLARLNPAGALTRIFSSETIVGTGLSMLRLMALLTVAGVFLFSQFETIAELVRLPLDVAALQVGELLCQVGLSLSVCCLVLGGADYGYRSWKYEQDLMMTAEEWRREQKDAEGDRQVQKSRRQADRNIPIESAASVSQTQSAESSV